ncbi:hypothetical protein JCM9279_005272 [Rhodotorula babjevae]
MAPARLVVVEDADRLVPPSPSAFNEGAHARAASPALSSGSQTSLARPPRSPNRPQGSPLLSTPTTSPRLAAAPALAPPHSTTAPDASRRTTASSKPPHAALSPADLPLEPVAPIRVLPTHPATLPYMWDSTASTTDDADTELDSTFDGEAGAGAALLAERRRREEAKVARRRVKHDAPSGRSRAAAHASGRASLDTAAAVTHALQLKSQMPLVEGRRGLGFAFSDKDGANEHPSNQPRRSSRSAPDARSARRPPARFAVTEDAAVALETDSTTSTTRRVRFEQPYRPPGRERSSSGGTIALQPEHIVFPDALPAPPTPTLSVTTPRSGGSRRSSAASASMFSPVSASLSSPPTSLAPSPASPRPRSPRRASGPVALPAELQAPRSSAKIYFPAGPARPSSIRSFDMPSPALSQMSLPNSVFPSRPRDKASHAAVASPVPPSPRLYFPSPTPSSARQPVFPSHSPRSQFETAAPFPVRPPASSTTSSPRPDPTFPSARTSRSPFPPPPQHSPQARYLASHVDAPVVVAARQSHSSAEQSAASARADSARRRSQSAPWEAPAMPSYLLDAGDPGDELDRMMKAQRRADLDERASSTARDERRRNIQAELLGYAVAAEVKGEQDSHIAPSAKEPLSPQDLAFDRALLDAEPKRKSLGVSLLSDEDVTRRWSTTPTITPETAHLSYPSSVGLRRVGAEGVESDGGSLTALASLDTGLNTSVSSTSSDISSLPSFPDVPHHHLAPPVPAFSIQNEHFPSSVANPVLSASAPLPSIGARPAAAAAPGSHRLSLASETGVSVYEDAPSSPPAAPVGAADEGDAQQHTREWVEGLAGGQARRRSLGDIGEEPELDDVTPMASPPLASITPPRPAAHVFPSPARSAASARPLERGSLPSSSSHPSLALDLHRTHSPAASLRSAGASSAASGAVSYVATSNGSPRAAQQGYFKPKLSLGKKLGAFFGSSTSSSSSVGSGSGGRVGMSRVAGIGSQDVLPLSASGEYELAGSGAGLGAGWAPHGRDRSGASASTSSFATVPPSPTVSSGPSAHVPTSSLGSSSVERAPSTASHSSSSPASASASSSAASAGLDALLARFEQEDKERFRGIAAARAQGAVLRRGSEGVAVA